MPNRWYQKGFSCSDTLLGIQIVTSTDVHCHLWARVSPEPPRIHLDPVMRRGVVFRSMPRYCFTVYKDIEQEEDGDTLDHTFIVPIWPACEKIWWYTYGQIALVDSPSESPWLMCQRGSPIVEIVLYPDADPEVSSFDGSVYSYAPPYTWSDVRGGINLLAQDNITLLYAHLQTWTVQWEWSVIRRSVLLFPTLVIPPNAEIIEAKLEMKLYRKYDYLLIEPRCAFTHCFPLEVDRISTGDWYRMTDTLLTDELAYADASTVGYMLWTLNETGLKHIKDNKPTGFAFRESRYDVSNYPPDWSSNKYSCFRFYSADNAILRKPFLTIKYQVECP